MERIDIGVLGCGTVGSGVAKILIEKKELLQSRVGAEIRFKYIADIDTRDRGIPFEPGVFISDANTIFEDPDVRIVVELIGGKGIAKDFILKAVQKGKHVVTANKALLADYGNEIFAAAAEHNVDLAYEASVGGCMPIIKTMRESLVGNRIIAMTGILNGTCNYILSKITDEGKTYHEALKEAQELGFAEADPTLDVEGYDTAHKLAILTALAYGVKINLNDIYVEGISRITPQDIEFACQFGYRIKLLAIGKDWGNAIEARVHPTMIPVGNILSNVNGSLNAITVSGDAVEDILLYGHGAGMMPTASAVVGDIVDISRNILSGASKRIPLLSYPFDQIKDIPIMPIDDIRIPYYIRFSAMDKPGVLSKISGILGDNNISIESVHQKGRDRHYGAVPIVMVTHPAREADLKKALQVISKLDVVTDDTMLIRIENENIQD